MATQLKKGDKVRMVNCGESDLYPDTLWTCRTDSWFHQYGDREEVVMLEGKAGSFRCDCLEKMVCEDRHFGRCHGLLCTCSKWIPAPKTKKCEQR